MEAIIPVPGGLCLVHIKIWMETIFIALPIYNKHMKKLKNKKSGFSLIELLVVTTIIIVLATIGVVSYRTASRNSRNAKRKADLEVMRQAMIMYRSEEGAYPSGNFASVKTTLENGGYIVDGSEISDPQGNDYIYSTGEFKAFLEPGNEEYTVKLP